MEIKEGIVLKEINGLSCLVQIDDAEVVCSMGAKVIMNAYRVIVGDKVYVKGVKILGPRERMLYELKWSINHSPKSPEEYERHFRKAKDSSR